MKTLIDEAKKTIDQLFSKDKFQVGSAVKTKSGKIYTGISINCQKMNLCAEWTAIGKAFSEGNNDIEISVAIRKKDDGSYEIYPPCALCRELFITYCPNAEIIISENKKVKASELLPHP